MKKRQEQVEDFGDEERVEWKIREGWSRPVVN